MTTERYFVHYAAHSDFEQGIFVPYLTLEEAERQVAYDRINGMDDDFVVQLFKEEYLVPKFGWTTHGLAQASELPHLDSEKRRQGRVHSHSQLLKASDKHINKLLREIAEAPGKEIEMVHRALLEGDPRFHPKGSVPGNAYSWMTGGTATGGATALAVSTAKTLVLVQASSANQPAIVEVGISFDGITSSAVPVLVELVSGTGGTAGTPRAALAAGKQLRGWPTQASQTTCADSYSAEPGTQLVNRKWLVPPNGGLFVIQFPLGREPTGLVTAATDGKTWSVRATAPAVVNAHSYIEFEE